MWCSLRIARSTLARQHECKHVFVSAPLAVVSLGVLKQLLLGLKGWFTQNRCGTVCYSLVHFEGDTVHLA